MDAVNQWIAWASQGNNWVAFLVVGLIGLFLGWLFTRIPAARARGELEARVAELESQLRRAKRQAEEAQQQADKLQKTVNSTQASLEQTEAELTAAKEELEPHIYARILNTETQVASGGTLVIRYRAPQGTSPVLNVYDPDETQLVTGASMTLIKVAIA